MTIAQTAIGLLRQHILSTDRIHGIITNGGSAPNVIPAHTSAKYVVRSETLDRPRSCGLRFIAALKLEALATGATVEITGGDKPYAEMNHDEEIAALYRKNSEDLGRPFPSVGEWKPPYGIDRHGQLSWAMPSIHPMIGINSLPAANHQRSSPRTASLPMRIRH